MYWRNRKNTWMFTIGFLFGVDCIMEASKARYFTRSYLFDRTS